MFVQPVIFIQNGNLRCFDGRNIPEHVPHTFKVVVHFTPAAHEESFGYIFSSVTAAAGKIKFFEQMNMFTFHLAIPDQVKRS